MWLVGGQLDIYLGSHSCEWCIIFILLQFIMCIVSIYHLSLCPCV